MIATNATSNVNATDVFAQIIESIPGGIIYVDHNWEILYTNNNIQAMLGKTQEDMLGTNLWKFFPASEDLKIYSELHNTVVLQQQVCFEEYFPFLELWLEINAYPSKNNLSIHLKDISLQKKQERMIKDTNKRFEQVLGFITECVWEWEVGAPQAIWHGDKLVKLLGYDEHEQGSVAFWETSVHPDDLERIRENLNQALENGEAEYSHQYRLRKKEGDYIHVRDRARIIRCKNRNPIKVIGVTDDITVQQLYEQTLVQSKASYQSLFDCAPFPKWVYDRETLRFLDVNACAISHFGYTREEFLQMTILDIRPIEDHQKVIDSIRNKKLVGGVWAYIKKNGERVLAELSATPLYFQNQNVYLASIHDITERTKTELALKASEQKLSGILESLGDGFFAVDRNWTITYLNGKAESLIGMNREQLIGLNFWEVFKDAETSLFYTEYQRAMKDNVPVRFEEYYPGLDAWFELNAFPSSDGLSVYFKNITERKKLEEKSKENEQKLQRTEDDLKNVLESMTDGFYTLDRNWTIQYATDKVAVMLGLKKEDYIGKNLWTSLPDLVHSKFYTEYHRAFEENTFVSFEEFLPMFNMWFEVNAYPNKNVLACYVKDITENKNDKNRLEFIARATSEVIWELELPSMETVINKENFLKVFGYSLPDKQDHYTFWLEKVHPVDAQAVLKKNQMALEQNLDNYVHEYLFQKSDGSWAYVKDRVFIVRDGQGKPVKLIGAMADVTNERLAEKAIIESEQTYKTLFDQASLPKAVYDKETLKILKVNHAAIEHYGYSNEEFLNMTILDLRPLEDVPKLKKVLSIPTSNSRKQLGIWTHIKKGGKRMRAEVSIATIDYKGKVCNLATIDDVTEKLKLNEQLTREKVEKQQAITKATLDAQERERSEIGRELHDGVNQVLATAKLYVENIKYYPEQIETFVDKSISLIQKSIQEIRVLSKALVTPTIADLGYHDALEEMFHSYKDLKQFEIDYFIHPEVEKIDKDVKLTIYRIFQEQLNNTVKYAKASKVKAQLLLNGKELIVLIEDNGIGFDTNVRKSGIGLNNIKNRAELFKGQVKVKSAVGKGCRMEIAFPIPDAIGNI